ncbi:MAG: hypothetical protein R2909_15480 [Gemmatimonadales bacterium]
MPALKGQLPVLITANRAMDIENARIARVPAPGRSSRAGSRPGRWPTVIAAARIPVVVDPTTDIPSFDGLARD